ncbi:glycosyl hydrolase family 28-related protein [Tistrella bauzanensis]|uniref:glycosyl hydrolase family 28-related protein n=2 Tax=Tistrella TaxID=171436 RepID=UPI0031FB9351
MMSTDASDVIYQYPETEIAVATYCSRVNGLLPTGVDPEPDQGGSPPGEYNLHTEARTLAEKLNAQYLDARDFGATGDGISDDTDALRTLFDARLDLVGWGKTSADINIGTGAGLPETFADAWKVVLLPPGTYRVRKALSVRSNTIVLAHGAIIKALPVNEVDPFIDWDRGYWDARTNTSDSGTGHLGGLVSIRHAQNVHWYGGTLDANNIVIRAGCNALGISAPSANAISHGGRIIVQDVRIRGCRNNLLSNTVGLLDSFQGGGGKAITLQLGQSEVILRNILVDDCDYVATIEGTASNDRELRQVVVDTLIAKNCKYGFIIQGTASQMESSCDLKNIWLHNVGNAAYEAEIPDGTTYGDFADDPRRIGGVLTLYNANNVHADIRISNDNITGVTGTGGSDLIRGTARNSHIRIQGYVAKLNHLWNTTFTQQDARISSITVTNGGSGYADTDTVDYHHDLIGGGPSNDRAVTLTIVGGVITEAVMEPTAFYADGPDGKTLDTGKGYQRPPTLTVVSSSGSGAVLTPVMSYPFNTANGTGGIFNVTLDVELEVGEHGGFLVKHLPHAKPTGLDIRAAIRRASSLAAPVTAIYDYEEDDIDNVQARNRFELVMRDTQKVIRGRFDRTLNVMKTADLQALDGPLVELGDQLFQGATRFDGTIDNRFINHRLNLTNGTPAVVVENAALPAGFRGVIIVSSLGLSYQHTALVLKSEVSATLVLVPLGTGSAYTLSVDAATQDVIATSTAAGTVATRVVVVPFDASTH